jgi:pyruvate ferredoxin oxidoreductase gamma subunit/2-oxoisovalerate ferredoxin oxidoreductase gamma subunit
MIEIRIHGRGGQGAITAAKILGEAVVAEGKWAQKSAMYGGERRGAPVQSFLRISDAPIRESHSIIEPNCILVIDQTIINEINVTDGLKEDGYAIINSSFNPAAVKLPLRPKTVTTLDALKISNEVFGPRPIPIVNTPMLGALVKTTGWIRLDSLIEPIKETFSGLAGDKNIEAAKLGYERTITT